MPTTPPEKVSKQATATRRGHRPRKSSKSLWSSPWIPLGPLVAGLALSLGFHVTFRVWDQTKTDEPLDISPRFAAEPLPGTSLDNLIRRYGNQLPLLLNPATQPDRPVPPPILPPNATADATTGSTPQPGDGNRVAPAAPATPQVTPERQEERPAQNQTTLVAPRLPPPVPPPPPSLGAPQLPSP